MCPQAVWKLAFCKQNNSLITLGEGYPAANPRYMEEPICDADGLNLKKAYVGISEFLKTVHIPHICINTFADTKLYRIE